MFIVKYLDVFYIIPTLFEMKSVCEKKQEKKKDTHPPKKNLPGKQKKPHSTKPNKTINPKPHPFQNKTKHNKTQTNCSPIMRARQSNQTPRQ